MILRFPNLGLIFTNTLDWLVFPSLKSGHALLRPLAWTHLRFILRFCGVPSGITAGPNPQTCLAPFTGTATGAGKTPPPAVRPGTPNRRLRARTCVDAGNTASGRAEPGRRQSGSCQQLLWLTSACAALSPPGLWGRGGGRGAPPGPGGGGSWQAAIPNASPLRLHPLSG